VPRFVQWALAGEPIRIYGTGRQSRCFCYVHDVVDAVIGLIQCETAVGKVFNVGSSEEITIDGLADRVLQLTGSQSRKEFVPYEMAYGQPIEDMMRRVPSTERIKHAIDWQAKTSLNQTLQVIIDHFKKE
jgi:UDP-glucose 4-epimerase